MGDFSSLAPASSGPLAAEATAEVASLLTEAGVFFNSRLQIEESVALLAQRVAERLEADCLLFLVSRNTDALALAAWHTAMPERRALLAEHAAKGWSLAQRELGPQLLGGKPLHGELGAEAPETLRPGAGEGPFLAVPLHHGPELVGVFLVARPGGEAGFSSEETALLVTLAPQTAAGVVNARTLAGERWQRQKAELMFQASKAVHTELHFDQAIREIALLLKQSIKAPWVGLLEYQAAERALSLLGSTSEPAVDLRLGSQRLALEVWPEAAEILQCPQSARLPLPEALRQVTGHPGTHAWAFPLVHKQVPQGLVLLQAPPGEEDCAPETSEVATGIAELVALAIANQHLMDQEAKARIQIIRSQAAAQEREVLLRQIVHDLRNATQAMSLVVEDIELSAGGDPGVQRSLNTLNSQITFISNFLKEKLNWIHHGDRSQSEQATSLAAVFAEIEGRFGPAARAKHQRLVVSAPEPIKVHLSSVQIEQIVGNLLDNAIKYTPEHGEIRLWADVSDGWVTVYVADNGPGIPVSDQARLGEVGYRGRQAQEGTGLGLANVRQLVTRAGGLFGVSSHPTVGTTFHVSLPTTAWGRVIS